MTDFEKLPKSFQTPQLKEYYDLLKQKRGTLILKRVLDFVFGLILFVLLLPINIVIAFLVGFTSKGPIFFLQKRVGKNGKIFKIFKYRTMVINAEAKGTQITVGNRDPRITTVGYYLRKLRLDEFPQLINVILGQMSFVGARPEVERYVEHYSSEMLATLLLEPGITGLASLEFKDENEILAQGEDPEWQYINKILPIKMDLNLKYLKNLSIKNDFKILLKTFLLFFK